MRSGVDRTTPRDDAPAARGRGAARIDGFTVSFEAVSPCETLPVRLGDTFVYSGAYVGALLERSPATAGQERKAEILLHLVVEGSFHGDYDGVAVTATAGDLVCCDLDRPVRQRVEHAKIVTTVIPRPKDGVLAHISRRLHGAKLEGGAARLLADQILSLSRNPTPFRTTSAWWIGEALERLAEATVCELVGKDDAARFDAPQKGVRDVLRQCLSDASVTAEDIAKRAGVSRSTLYRLFAKRGGVMAHLTEQRLIRARRALADASDGRTVAEISNSLGFSTPANFSRAFKGLYGQTPGELRRVSRSSGL